MMNTNHSNGNDNHYSEQCKVFYFTRDGAGTVSATVKLSEGLNLIQSMREQGWYFVWAMIADGSEAR